MSFLTKQKETPEFINNYLKYKRFIEDGAQTTADESYYDLKALLRFVKLSLYDKNRLNTITKEEFKQIDIIDVTLEDLDKVTSFQLHDFMSFTHVVLENDAKTMNRKLASIKRFFEYG